MPSKTLWFNRELVLQIFRSVGWISIIYFLVLVFSLPFEMLVLYSDETINHHSLEPVRSLFQFGMDIQITLLVAIPVLMSVFLFRFLQVKQAAEMMHNLPIKREKIFHHYALTGIIALTLPVVLTAFIVLIMYQTLDLNSYFQLSDIYIWTGTTILLNMLLFTAGIFIAMMTGISAVQGVLTYIFLLFPAGIALLLLTNINLLLFGFPGDYYLNRNIEKWSPLTVAAIIDERPLNWTEVVIYVVITLLLYVLALYFYKKRKTESASEAIAFPKLRSIFKYGVTFCTMLLGGVYLSETLSSQSGWLIFGYVVGAVIGYYIAEMVLQKTWRVFRKVKGLVIYGVSMTVIIVGIQALSVYENRVPEQDEVKKVLLADSPHVYMEQRSVGYVFSPGSLKEQANIQTVRELHQQIITDKDVVETDEGQYETAFFLYELNNGKRVIRQYSVDKSKYHELYKSISETEEYKRATHEIFHLDGDEVDYFSITANGPVNKSVMIKNPEEIQEFIGIFQNDVLIESYEDSLYYQGYGSSLEFSMGKDHFVYLNIKPTYKGIEQWLEGRELLERSRVMAEDVASIQIATGVSIDLQMMDPEAIAEEVENRADVLKIDDMEQINELLTSIGSPRNHQFVVVLRYEGRDYPEIYFMDEKHAPAFVKDHFK